jgi:hypothetical protein
MLKPSVALFMIISAFGLGTEYGRAAEPAPFSEFNLTQLVRDEHDLIADMVQRQLADERDHYSEPRTAVVTSPVASQRARAGRPLTRARHES